MLSGPEAFVVRFKKVFKEFDGTPGRNDDGSHGWNFTLSYVRNVRDILLGINRLELLI